MHDAIKLILASAFATPALSACSGDSNPDQNVIITENVPADAEIEAVPADEGGSAPEQPGNELDPDGDGNFTVNSH